MCHHALLASLLDLQYPEHLRFVYTTCVGLIHQETSIRVGGQLSALVIINPIK